MVTTTPIRPRVVIGDKLVSAPSNTLYQTLNRPVDMDNVARYANIAEETATQFGVGALAQSHGSAAYGAYALAIDHASVAIGLHSKSRSQGTVAVGMEADAWKNGGISIGDRAKCEGPRSIVIGQNATATNGTKRYSIAIGYYAKCDAEAGIAIGVDALAQATGVTTGPICIGASSRARAVAAIVLGISSLADGINGIAIGGNCSAAHANSIVIGNQVTSTQTNEMRIGDSAGTPIKVRFSDIPRFDGATQTTVGAAGGATALPATPTGYLEVNIAGTARVIPFYAKS